jgi:hypothetical protein
MEKVMKKGTNDKKINTCIAAFTKQAKLYYDSR